LRNCHLNSHFALPGYSLISKPRRKHKRGGGVGLYVSNDLTYSVLDNIDDSLCDVCECCAIEIINSQSPNIIILSLYKPPEIDIGLFDIIFSKFLKDFTGNNNNKKQIISADWNIDLLKANSDSKVDRFLNNMLSFGFLPTITIPTRITEKTATLLDNIFINCAVADYFTRAIYDDISDHLPILLDIKFGYTKSKNNDISHKNRYIMNEKNYLKFENSLVNENWSFLDKYQINKFSPNEAYNIFLDKFKICYDRAFLLQNNKSCKNRRGKPLLPWMTENLIRSCRKKSRLLKIYKKTGAAVARNKYVKYKNTLKQALRHEEKYYYEQQFQAVASDARKTWKIINSLLNKQTNKKLSHIFQSNNITTTDKTVIVKMFNEFFVNLGPDLAKKIAPSKRNKLLEGIPHIKECMALSPTDANEVANMILSLKNTASCGSDQISVAAIKTISNIISPLLSALINHSMDKGIFPDALKLAKNLPIYKSGDKT